MNNLKNHKYPLMKLKDFSCSELQDAWIEHKKTIQFINRIDNPSKLLLKLKASHQSKIKCLERAQRIINEFKEE